MFFDALLWIARTGAPWRDLPERLGTWSAVYQRYAYWCAKGHFERLFQSVQQAAPENNCLASTRTSAGFARLPEKSAVPA